MHLDIGGPQSDSVRLSLSKDQDGHPVLYANTSTSDDNPWELIRFYESNGKLVGEICSPVSDPLIATDAKGHLKTINEGDNG